MSGLKEACKDHSAKVLHEATGGAGLPILGTLQALKASSHEVKGVLSGTLALYLVKLQVENKGSL